MLGFQLTIVSARAKGLVLPENSISRTKQEKNKALALDLINLI
jgi:hypothetical protein